MKKMVIAACAIVFATIAQASQIKWSNTAVYASGQGTDLIVNAPIYLVNIVDLTQTDILASMRGGSTLADAIGSKAVATLSTGADGKLAATAVAVDKYADNSIQTLFTVIANADNSEVFFTANKNVTIKGTGDSLASFASTASKNQAFGPDASFSSAGWYQVAPEPTSGLLVLIGMAGLALRRRRA